MSRNPFLVNGGGTALPPPNQRIGFAPDPDKEVVATRSVKLKTKSAVQKEQDFKEREEYKARFEENADRTIEYNNEKTTKAVEVISRYIKLIEDKTLARNRAIIANDVEKEIRDKVIKLALDMNNDETEEDNGKGSIILLTVVMKMLLKFRDRFNDLEFENQQLKRELSKLSSLLPQQTSNAAK